jgi:glycosyltransferase involved in cell wall biosynthesis
VVLVGADPDKVHCPNATVRSWSYEQEVEEVQRFSVGVLPQFRDVWTQGKCALKALLYMACGVPCIATPFGAALEFIRPGENGLFADSPEEWRDALARLRDRDYRQRMGEAARQTVEEQYSLRVAAPRLKELLESVE